MNAKCFVCVHWLELFDTHPSRKLIYCETFCFQSAKTMIFVRGAMFVTILVYAFKQSFYVRLETIAVFVHYLESKKLN